MINLKNHFIFGKRNGFPLLKGKIIDLAVENVFKKAFTIEKYKNLSNGYKDIIKVIN